MYLQNTLYTYIQYYTTNYYLQLNSHWSMDIFKEYIWCFSGFIFFYSNRFGVNFTLGQTKLFWIYRRFVTTTMVNICKKHWLFLFIKKKTSIKILKSNLSIVSGMFQATVCCVCWECVCLCVCSDVFPSLHTGTAGPAVMCAGTDLCTRHKSWLQCEALCLHLDSHVLHNSRSSCFGETLSTLDTSSHQCVTQISQENPPLTQFHSVPVLVYFSFITKTLKAPTSVMLKKLTESPDSHATVCGRLKLPVVISSGAQGSIFAHGADQQDILPFLGQWEMNVAL